MLTLRLYNRIDQYVLPSIGFGDFLTQATPATLVVIEGNSSFNYLIQRYAERDGYSITPLSSSTTMEIICNLNPISVIFPSLENLEIWRAFKLQS
jgi:hypothetical protein